MSGCDGPGEAAVRHVPPALRSMYWGPRVAAIYSVFCVLYSDTDSRSGRLDKRLDLPRHNSSDQNRPANRIQPGQAMELLFYSGSQDSGVVLKEPRSCQISLLRAGQPSPERKRQTRSWSTCKQQDTLPPQCGSAASPPIPSVRSTVVQNTSISHPHLSRPPRIVILGLRASIRQGC